MNVKSVIGVDLGGTNIRVGRVRNNEVTDLNSQQITSNGSEREVLDEILASIHKTFDDSVLGIGVGVPSVVDVKRGIAYDVQNIPAFKEVRLRDILEAEFKVPTYINNDANCFVVGEKYFGIGRNHDNIVGMIIGTGFGAGIYANGKLLVGANCGAGEFGMVRYKDGIYEDYCSGRFFTNKLKTAGEEVYRKAVTGDRDALEAFKAFGVHLGNAISTIVFAVDPEIIILGGSVSMAFGYFRESMRDVLNDFPYRNSIKNLKIAASNLRNVSILGAAALYYENRDETPKEIEMIGK